MDRTTQVNLANAVVRLCVVGAMVGVVTLCGTLPAAADDVPYVDPSAVGFVGLCDASDHSIDHGDVAGKPFVRSAVASVAAVAPYDGDGRTATLFAFQPRDGSLPTEWSGQLLTAATRYDDPAHPTALATDVDDSLATFLEIYPPQWDGLIQLRMYLAVPGQPALTQQYAATDIRIDGDSWKVVRGGDAPCDSSSAQSIEDLLPRDTGQRATAAPAGSTAVADDDSAAASGPNVAIAILVIALLAVTGVAIRRRRSHGGPPDDSVTSQAHEKPVRTP